MIWFDNTTSYKIQFNIHEKKEIWKKRKSFILSYVSSTGKSYDGFSKKAQKHEENNIMLCIKGRVDFSAQ